MLGSIIVSLLAVGLPIAAGISLAPKQQSERGIWTLMDQGRGYARSLMIAVQAKIALKQLPGDLRYPSSFHTD